MLSIFVVDLSAAAFALFCKWVPLRQKNLRVIRGLITKICLSNVIGYLCGLRTVFGLLLATIQQSQTWCLMYMVVDIKHQKTQKF